MSVERIKSGDAELAIEITGPDKSLPWLLVSNSLAADRSMWDGQMGWLTQTHRVIRYDTRGHGESSAPVRAYSFDDLVDDTVAILDHVDAEKADILGLSLGGMTALGLAINHPGRVGSMVVCDARADNPDAFRKSWDDRIALVQSKGMSGIIEGTLSRWFTDKVSKDVYDRAANVMRAMRTDGYIGCALALKELSYLKDLGKITAPVLYVVGEDDLAAPKEAMAEMAAATPNAAFMVLPGLAHVPNMEDPHAFKAAVAPFLARAT